MLYSCKMLLSETSGILEAKHVLIWTPYTVRDIVWNLHPGCNVDCYQQDGAGYGEIILNGGGQ
jgi:hypothetical protein